MKIVIIGGGKVGFSIAKTLINEKHSVTIIDNNESTVRKTNDKLKAMCIVGNGASIDTMIEAGIKTADLLIAVTAKDEINMVCCLMAKNLGVKYTLARIRNPEYSKATQIMQEQIGIDRIINPELVAAREIARLISFPGAVHADAFASGRVEMIGFIIRDEDGLDGKAVASLPKSLTDNVVICAIDRGGSLLIPHGDTVLRTGDTAYVMSGRAILTKFFKKLGRKTFRAKDVVIVGGGRVAVYLIPRLHDVGISTILIEENREKCLSMSSAFSYATVICGDGTDPELLLSENTDRADYFIAATGSDEENIFAGMNAKKLGAKRAIVKLSHTDSDDLLSNMNIDCAVKPRELIVSGILRYVRGKVNSAENEMLSLYKIIGGQAESIEFLATETTAFLNRPLKDISIKENVLLCAIIHNDELIIPNGDSTVQNGDHIIIITSSDSIAEINDILR